MNLKFSIVCFFILLEFACLKCPRYDENVDWKCFLSVLFSSKKNCFIFVSSVSAVISLFLKLLSTLLLIKILHGLIMYPRKSMPLFNGKSVTSGLRFSKRVSRTNARISQNHFKSSSLLFDNKIKSSTYLM